MRLVSLKQRSALSRPALFTISFSFEDFFPDVHTLSLRYEDRFPSVRNVSPPSERRVTSPLYIARVPESVPSFLSASIDKDSTFFSDVLFFLGDSFFVLSVVIFDMDQSVYSLFY